MLMGVARTFIAPRLIGGRYAVVFTRSASWLYKIRPLRSSPGVHRDVFSSHHTDAGFFWGAAMNSPSSSIPETGQEVRFAVAMSGGVSLAVWMGGVAREMNLLQQASNLRRSPSPAASADADRDDQCRELYRSLLNLLDVTVTTDVLSGTSAGGINAALLGLASVTGLDLGGLRDLWLRTGSLDMLLRDPGEPNPPSLMQGDKVLFSQLNTGLDNFYHSAGKYPPPARPEMSTTVFITTTTMSGETSRFTDDYGTLVPDVDHHGLFTFDQEALGAGGKPALTALALAARSSASFPAAFEPSYVPVNSSIDPAQGVPEHPDMAAFANMTRSHWAADGGLLANRPLTPLLAKVFAQPATGQVRRVLAFVVPDGGGIPRAKPEPVPDDDWDKPLTMAGALRADLGAQLSSVDCQRPGGDPRPQRADQRPPRPAAQPGRPGIAATRRPSVRRVTGLERRSDHRPDAARLRAPAGHRPGPAPARRDDAPADHDGDPGRVGGRARSGRGGPVRAGRAADGHDDGACPRLRLAGTASPAGGRRSGDGAAASQRGGRGLGRVGWRGCLRQSRPVRPAGFPRRADRRHPVDQAGVPAGHHR